MVHFNAGIRFTFSFFPFIGPLGAGKDVIYCWNLHVFFKEGCSLKQSNAHGYRNHRQELKISPGLIQACWELGGDGFSHCHAAKLHVQFWNYTSSLQSTTPLKFLCFWPTSLQDLHTLVHVPSLIFWPIWRLTYLFYCFITKSRDCSVLSPRQPSDLLWHQAYRF